MKRLLERKRYLVVLLAALLSVVLTLIVYTNVHRARVFLRDRIILLAYQTNINGSDAEMWADNLERAYPDAPGFEVGTYILQQVGNESITITSDDGWKQIFTRLASGQGDILFVNNKIFYEMLLPGGYLAPMEGEYKNAVQDQDGIVYGLDITGMTADGLYNLNTSTLVGKGQLMPIVSIDENAYVQGEDEIAPRVIAVVYKGSSHVEQAKSFLKDWFGVDAHA